MGSTLLEFAPSPERRARMREEMGVGDEFVWLTAGRIVPAKDYPNLLRRLCARPRRRPLGSPMGCRRGVGAEFRGSSSPGG